LSNIFGTKKQYLLSGIAQKASLPIIQSKRAISIKAGGSICFG
jgi:hypothetical protein